ncbi:hypothetical protein OC846_005399 [Tilletia horrida]|uniref:Uncharacterized protein n=1 Tax=Tilletia horrida TaxID=155126 RepID=A0AAN6JPJ5_9BASI|nr:hypothetical protein OC846_005399 [Tilletia horrida]KAK0548939.1 hypothetical protein OC845_003350 [Tilletia horrida]KAK0561836.1 hypothetical protein OC861_005627 [Tilletia horrida]
MAGPSLEVFKFGLYLFFPLAIMVHYGDPEWYHKNVLPVRDVFWPKDEDLYHPPRTSSDVKDALAEFRQKRIARREEREAAAAGTIRDAISSTTSASSSSATSRSARQSSPPATLRAASLRLAESERIPRSRDVQASVPNWAITAGRRLV